MSGGEVQALTALFELLSTLGALPFGLLFFSMVGPWMLAVLLVWFVERGQNKRHGEAVQMYRDNVELVKEVVKISTSLKQLTSDNQGYMLKHTETLMELAASIRTNQYCPAIRTEKKHVEVSANE